MLRQPRSAASFETISTLCSRAAGSTEGGDVAASDEGEGNGPDLKTAAENAWADAKRKNNPAGEYEIKKIFVVTENPIREYRVAIKKT